MAGNILFVDDEQDILSTLKRQLRKSDFTTFIATGAEEAYPILEKECIDIVVSDMRMPEVDGAEFLKVVSERWPDTVRILLTGYSDTESAIKAINEGKIYSFQTKPWESDQLLSLLQKAAELKSLQDEKRRLQKLTEEQREELLVLNKQLEQKVLERTKQLEESNKEIKSNYRNTILVFARLIDSMETEDNKGLSKRIADDAKALAELCQLKKETITDIYIAALLHRLGLIEIKQELRVKKPDEMNEKELAEYLTYPSIGATILSPLYGMEDISKYILNHRKMLENNKEEAFSDFTAGEDILTTVCSFHDKLLQNNLEDTAEWLLERKEFSPEIVEKFVSYQKNKIANAGKLQQYCELLTVSIAELQEGMELHEDLKTESGTLLLPKGVNLDTGTIERLKKFTKGNTTIEAKVIQYTES